MADSKWTMANSSLTPVKLYVTLSCMRKEVVFAIFLGGIIGATVAFGLWRANKALSSKNKPAEFIQTEAPKTEEKSSGVLEVTHPENNSVVSEANLKVSGKTTPESTVVISTGSKEVLLESDKKGEFSGTIELSGGANLLKVVSIDKDGNKEEVELAVVYSTELE